MRWFIGIAALAVLVSCMDTMDVPTPTEDLNGAYRVLATPRETNCSDSPEEIRTSYLITLAIHDDCCEMCGLDGTWNKTTRTATITSETSHLSISYSNALSEEEQRPVFRGIRSETNPSSGCSTSWTVVARKLAYE